MVKTKIIATLGPSSGSITVLRKMVLAGLDVVRLNFSHASHGEHQHRIDMVRILNKKYRRRIRILQDLEGHRIRIGKFVDKYKGAITLSKRNRILLTNRAGKSEKDAIPIDYPGSLSDIKTGSSIYIDDGNIMLVAKSGTKSHITAEVVIPGVLKENKGVNIPDINLKFKGLAEKDKDDIRFGIRNNVDFIAQSFVRNKKDILNIRDFIRGSGLNCGIIAKIENREGIKNIDGILNVSDGIMIARGDMGVSLPVYQVPMVQKMLIRKCNRKGKFVITATQMLESMAERITPTRAEVSDVANAILDGSDYLMLSAETAIGRYPVEAVKMMNDIIKFTEKDRRSEKV